MFSDLAFSKKLCYYLRSSEWLFEVLAETYLMIKLRFFIQKVFFYIGK